MEGEKKQASSSSSSSFTNELFGSKESSSSSSGLFHSIFPPPSKAHGKDYISSELTKKDQDSASRREKKFHSDYLEKEDKDRNRNKQMDMSSFYEQERTQPCHLSSSIYYGGQDIYNNPGATKKTPAGQPTYSKDGEDDGRASRGNWWQGSLYY
uniref:uncharacterized protein LOC122593918 isoform X2 n=1 Tax=Erigeron canadensis TaxID=72917 RepID=UPI001CB8EEE1|nr:uncharacterized protein LOC122593918 isoform X2 [Erigeron canadensis]